ncbi:MAG: cell division ATP-binding protein FtsE [Patescibacteria group bacterium]
MIKFVNINKSYSANVEALKNLNLEIKDGEFVSVIGQSGAGKSTLLKLISGELQPEEGEVWVNEVRVDLLKPEFLPHYRRRIGTIFQDYKLLHNRNVFDNVAFALKASGEKNNKEINNRVETALARVNLADKRNRFPKELSGGESQRVAIARALVHDPLIIVADEPTGNLDRINTFDIIGLLLDINKTGTTVVLATHDQEVVDKIKQRVLTVVDGEIVRDQEVGGYLV